MAAWTANGWFESAWYSGAWYGVVVEGESPTGGWLNEYNAYKQRKESAEKERRRIMDAIRELDGVDGEIAELLHSEDGNKQEDEYNEELRTLLSKAVTEAEIAHVGLLTERVARAYRRAMDKATFSAIQALERELDRAMEEEDFMFLVMLT